jgi:hypothetical protein
MGSQKIEINHASSVGGHSCFSLRTIGDFGKVEVLLRQVAMKPKYDIEGTKIEGEGAKSKLCQVNQPLG